MTNNTKLARDAWAFWCPQKIGTIPAQFCTLDCVGLGLFICVFKDYTKDVNKRKQVTGGKNDG